jgi:hypothetical protein
MSAATAAFFGSGRGSGRLNGAGTARRLRRRLACRLSAATACQPASCRHRGAGGAASRRTARSRLVQRASREGLADVALSPFTQWVAGRRKTGRHSKATLPAHGRGAPSARRNRDTCQQSWQWWLRSFFPVRPCGRGCAAVRAPPEKGSMEPLKSIQDAANSMKNGALRFVEVAPVQIPGDHVLKSVVAVVFRKGRLDTGALAGVVAVAAVEDGARLRFNCST